MKRIQQDIFQSEPKFCLHCILFTHCLCSSGIVLALIIDELTIESLEYLTMKYAFANSLDLWSTNEWQLGGFYFSLYGFLSGCLQHILVEKGEGMLFYLLRLRMYP